MLFWSLHFVKTPHKQRLTISDPLHQLFALPQTSRRNIRHLALQVHMPPGQLTGTLALRGPRLGLALPLPTQSDKIIWKKMKLFNRKWNYLKKNEIIWKKIKLFEKKIKLFDKKMKSFKRKWNYLIKKWNHLKENEIIWKKWNYL